MQKRIKGIMYDTHYPTMITQSVSLTSLSGNICIRLFRTPEGHWFKTIGPADETTRSESAISRAMDPVSAKQWLKKHHLTLPGG